MLKLKKDISLFIPIFVTFFALVSLIFNTKKFKNSTDIEISYYKFLRIGDLFFSIFLFIVSFAGFYLLIESWYKTNLESHFFKIRISILSLVLIFSVLLYLDNLRFHKSLKNNANKSFIEEIGT
ncbi:hypothetical protein [Polaribacter sp.]|uniref:hypothetical protein n=1 Tax=Polaribacter sp. TaxID=1920175 RepID=UPI003F6AB315